MRNLRVFFEKTRYWQMEPADDLVSAGYCLANPGEEYVVFLDQPQPFDLKIEEASSELRAEWFDPVKGETTEGPRIAPGGNRITPPSDGKKMIVLHVFRE